MANEQALEKKRQIVKEITDNIKSSTTIVFFDYRGLSVSQITELRKKLKEKNCDLKIYKNTLTKRALKELDYDFDQTLIGPNGIVFSKNTTEPLKILTEYAKKNKDLIIKSGIIEGNVSTLEYINQLASLPSREVLLTMLASGMLEIVKDLSICLNLICKQKEDMVKEG
ncbi:MAG: 50S ribosomal protein L10 [Bacilli bacterium]|jgi:large subunit ribosomal protein L10